MAVSCNHPGRLVAQRPSGCRCNVRSFVEFAELADDDKEKFCLDGRKEDAKHLFEPFMEIWKDLGDLPCPILRVLTICVARGTGVSA